MAKVPERVNTGIERLDQMLDGGLLRRSSVLVPGVPGAGKTTLGLQFLYEGAVRFNEPGFFVTFEEFPSSLSRDAGGLGWDFRELERQHKMRLVFSSPEIFWPASRRYHNPPPIFKSRGGVDGHFAVPAAGRRLQEPLSRTRHHLFAKR